jgi:hypothetical protein
VTGLTAGVTYTFTVVASSLAGPGVPSVASTTVAPAAPGQPTGVTATSGDDTSSLVSWTAPTFNGGRPITLYTVTASPGGATCTTTTTTSCRVNGLSNRNSYTFIVTATNNVGTGDPSVASASATVGPPATVPGAPTSVTFGLISAWRAVITWSAPVSDGGRAVLSYTVTLLWNGAPTEAVCVGVTATSCEFFPLNPADAVKISVIVTANNAIGAGIASTPVAAPTVPGAPTGVTASSYRSRYSVVSWTAPASNGGNAITRYTVTSSPGGFACETETTSCTVTGLTNGVLYTFTVTATNGVGTGAPSVASAAVLPADRPDSPYGLIASARNDGSAVVLWIAGSNGGDPDVTYTVTSSPGGFTCITSSTSCRVNGLTNGVGYRFTVTAVNHAGSNYEGMGPAISNLVRPQSSITLPGAPTITSVSTVSDGVATIDWSAPAESGSTILSYTVTASPGGRTCTWSYTSCRMTGLTAGVAYTYVVTATNGMGAGAASAPSAPVGSVVTRDLGGFAFTGQGGYADGGNQIRHNQRIRHVEYVVVLLRDPG